MTRWQSVKVTDFHATEALQKHALSVKSGPIL
jgi:hypothetical protein